MMPKNVALLKEFFQLLFTDELLESIVENTNLYASQKGYNIHFSVEDIQAYLVST